MATCDGCGDPGKYNCSECDFVYCDSCLRVHEKNKLTKDHVATLITKGYSSMSTDETFNSSKNHCRKHKTKHALLVCKTCLIIMCDDCRQDHKDHDIYNCIDNCSLVQRACRSHAQMLYSILNNMEKEHDVRKERATVYSKAKIITHEKLNSAISKLTKAGNLTLRQLETTEEVEKNVESTQSKHILEVDEQIDNLNGIRNSTDVCALVTSILDSASVIHTLEEYKEDNFALHEEVPLVSDILPHLSTLEKAVDKVVRKFHVNIQVPSQAEESGSKQSEAKELRADVPANRSNLGEQVSKPAYNRIQDFKSCVPIEQVQLDGTSVNGYRMCKCGKNEKDIILHGVKENIIYVYKTDNGQCEKHEVNFKIWCMIRVSEEQFIACEEGTNRTHLLDKSWKIRQTMDTKTGTDQALAYHSNQRFLKLHRVGQKNCKVKISLYNVCSGMFVKENEVHVTVEDKPYNMGLGSNNKVVYLSASSTVYTVDLQNAAVESYDVSKHMSAIRAIHVDQKDNILLADGKGRIHHVYNKKYHGVIAKPGGYVWGIALGGDLLFASSSSELWKYKIGKQSK